MSRLLIPAIGAFVLAGCATDPNLVWFEGAAITYKVSDGGKDKFALVAQGAGAHKAEQVERAFLSRARDLCSGRMFQSDVKLEPYQYSAPSGVLGGSTYHQAYRAVGTVACN